MTISSAGIGSGLDVNSLVTQLVSAERAPTEDRLSRTESATKTTLSALGVFKAVLAALQTSVNGLKGTTSIFGKVLAKSSNEDLFTATAANGTAAGSFSVEVLETAKAEKIATGSYASATTAVGNGTVTLHVGSDTFSVNLTDGDNTLEALRDKINNASDNKGVTAAILNDAGGARLILTSKETGVAKAVTLTSAANPGGASFITTSEINPAADAHVKIDGFDYYSGSNTITGAIDGVTLTLLAPEPGTTSTLSLTPDSGAASDAVQAFVKAYNSFVTTMAQYTKFDSATKTAGPLLGDPAVSGTQQQIRTVLSGAVSSGDFTMLSQLGVTTQTDGTLKVDSAKLTSAIQSDSDSVKALFGGTDGLATKLGAVLDGVLGTDGRLQAKTKSLQGQLDDVGKQRDALDLRMSMVEKRYRAQFTALDSLLGQLQTTSSFLTQQLSHLPGSG